MGGKLHPLNLIPDLCVSSRVYMVPPPPPFSLRFFLFFFINLCFFLVFILFDEFMVPSTD